METSAGFWVTVVPAPWPVPSEVATIWVVVTAEEVTLALAAARPVAPPRTAVAVVVAAVFDTAVMAAVTVPPVAVAAVPAAIAPAAWAWATVPPDAATAVAAPMAAAATAVCAAPRATTAAIPILAPDSAATTWRVTS